MTRLQNAKKQLSEAMAALESAATNAINVSQEVSASANSSQMVDQTVAGADLSALIDEVNIIEAKLSEAVAMIASVDTSTVRSNKTNGEAVMQSLIASVGQIGEARLLAMVALILADRAVGPSTDKAHNHAGPASSNISEHDDTAAEVLEEAAARIAVLASKLASGTTNP